jgi:hypothetical protein
MKLFRRMARAKFGIILEEEDDQMNFKGKGRGSNGAEPPVQNTATCQYRMIRIGQNVGADYLAYPLRIWDVQYIDSGPIILTDFSWFSSVPPGKYRNNTY